MAEVSMLWHAETGLWWAVKTSGRSNHRIFCACMYVWLVWVHRHLYLCAGCDYICLYVLSLCMFSLRQEASTGSGKSPCLLTAIRLSSPGQWKDIHDNGSSPRTWAPLLPGTAASDAVIKTKPLKSTENRRNVQGRSVPISMTFTATQQAVNKNRSAAIDRSIGFRKNGSRANEFDSSLWLLMTLLPDSNLTIWQSVLWEGALMAKTSRDCRNETAVSNETGSNGQLSPRPRASTDTVNFTWRWTQTGWLSFSFFPSNLTHIWSSGG